MPSLRHAVVVSVIRLTRKRAYASAAGLHAAIAADRKTERIDPPRSVLRNALLRRDDSLGFPVFTLTPQSGGATRRLVYLHGGGYVFEIAKQHWTFLARLASRLDATVTVPIYPLAPEHGWRDSVPVLTSMLAEEIASNPTPVTVMGDSAGGGLALVLVHRLREAGVRPRNAVLIAPALDATMSDPESAAVDLVDPWLGIDGIREAGRLWAGGDDVSRPEVSPLFASQADLPPTLVLIGARDCPRPAVARPRSQGACGRLTC